MNKAQTLYRKILIQEGGNAVDNVTPIVKANVEPTLQKVFAILDEMDPGNNHTAIGSTGLKAKNGDLDIAVDTSLGLAGLTAKLKETPYEVNMNKGLNQVSIGFPQIGPDGHETGELVQVDLMIGKVDWMKFKYAGFSETETQYKSLGRLACLGAILKYMTGNETEKSYGTNNFGVFPKQNGKKIEGSLIDDPKKVVALVNQYSAEPWTRKELESPIEYMWPKITKAFPNQAMEMGTYIEHFLAGQGYTWKNPLDDSKMVEYIKKAKHRILAESITHIEDLIHAEQGGGEKTLKYIDSLISEIKGGSSGLKTSTKIDGSPVVYVGRNYPGLPKGIFVGYKSLFNKDPKPYFRGDESKIDADYTDIPDKAASLKQILKYAPDMNIPDGQIWKGDVLFIKGSPTKGTEEYSDKQGKHWITCKPNALKYAAEINSDVGKAMMAAKIGIAFHTRITGQGLAPKDQTETAGVDLSVVNPISDLFLIDGTIPSMSAGPKDDGDLEEIVTLRSRLDGHLSQCKDLIDELPGAFIGVLNKFENEMVKQGNQFSTDLETFVGLLKDFVTQSYKSAKGKKYADWIELHLNEFMALFQFQTDVVSIKNKLLKRLNAMPKGIMPVNDETEGQFVQGEEEGFAVADQEGGIVKLVNRAGFSRTNFLHNNSKEKISSDAKEFLEFYLHEAGSSAERQENGFINAIKNVQKPINLIAGDVTISGVTDANKYKGRQASGSEPYTDVVLSTNSGPVNISMKGPTAPSLAGGGLSGLELAVPGLGARFMQAAFDLLILLDYKDGDKVPDIYGKIKAKDKLAIVIGNEEMGGPIDYMYIGPMDILSELKDNELIMNGNLYPAKKYAKTHKLYFRLRARRKDQRFDSSASAYGIPKIYGESPSKKDKGGRIVVTDRIPNNALFVNVK